ncbi:hypothetical protein D1B31_02200 [Neobacillus notoginsengisoli]|uniref:Uncharacterized protein n=1 Tax=Neobacillus notoginsengisoli TaxID=1578198 RepID=A0A417Z0U2_9BACI|nr:hypothetical protein D1B31_02200 [Neobacillus notoginsengisoli]
MVLKTIIHSPNIGLIHLYKLSSFSNFVSSQFIVHSNMQKELAKTQNAVKHMAELITVPGTPHNTEI